MDWYTKRALQQAWRMDDMRYGRQHNRITAVLPPSGRHEGVNTEAIRYEPNPARDRRGRRV